jgi:hypothetical protein
MILAWLSQKKAAECNRKLRESNQMPRDHQTADSIRHPEVAGIADADTQHKVGRASKIPQTGDVFSPDKWFNYE